MKTAQDMLGVGGAPKDKENIATKGLGVLLENGPYGLILYLETNVKDSIGRHYIKHLIGLCRYDQLDVYLGTAAPSNADFGQATAWLRDVAVNVDSYLFVKRLWQQTLTYVRYHAKALNVNEQAGVD